MLAPRKKLWSTPVEVIDEAIALLAPLPGETVFDIGAGDGNFILRCSECTESRCIGIEIDEERALHAQRLIEQRELNHRCQMICANALEQDYSGGSCFFMYLIPRGLRIIAPILLKLAEKEGTTIRVVTYMSPLPGVPCCTVRKVFTETHPEAQWPLFYYELSSGSAASDLAPNV